MGTDRNQELHAAAVLLRLTARTPAEEAYFRGYVSGVSRRLARGLGPDEPEAVAFEFMQDMLDGTTQLLARGYRAGLAGEVICL